VVWRGRCSCAYEQNIYGKKKGWEPGGFTSPLEESAEGGEEKKKPKREGWGWRDYGPKTGKESGIHQELPASKRRGEGSVILRQGEKNGKETSNLHCIPGGTRFLSKIKKGNDSISLDPMELNRSYFSAINR